MFLRYDATNGKKYALHPAQIRGLEGNRANTETKILATIGGDPLTIRVKKPFDEVYAEWEQARERGGEE
jgi:hypothetical protein